MSLRVVNDKFNDRQGTVTVEADTQEEVMSSAAKQLAITHAASKLSRPGVSGNEVAYPVDAEGNTSEELVLGRGGTVAAYRCDFQLTGGL